MKTKKKKPRKKVTQITLQDSPTIKVIQPKKVKKRYMVYLPENDTEYIKAHLQGSSLSYVLAQFIQVVAGQIRRRKMPTNEHTVLNTVLYDLFEHYKGKK